MAGPFSLLIYEVAGQELLTRPVFMIGSKYDFPVFLHAPSDLKNHDLSFS